MTPPCITPTEKHWALLGVNVWENSNIFHLTDLKINYNIVETEIKNNGIL